MENKIENVTVIAKERLFFIDREARGEDPNVEAGKTTKVTAEKAEQLVALKLVEIVPAGKKVEDKPADKPTADKPKEN